jgi:hypothetical protein
MKKIDVFIAAAVVIVDRKVMAGYPVVGTPADYIGTRCLLSLRTRRRTTLSQKKISKKKYKSHH